MQQDLKKGELSIRNESDINAALPVINSSKEQLIKDLKNNNITEDIKFIAYDRLADVQPFTKSHQTASQMKSDTAKAMTVLKSFTLKHLDIIRREAMDSFVQAASEKTFEGFITAMRAVGKIAKLAAIFTVCTASTDTKKDLKE